MLGGRVLGLYSLMDDCDDDCDNIDPMISHSDFLAENFEYVPSIPPDTCQ